MKKHIGFTNPSPELLQWLINRLQELSTDGASEFAEALRELLNGNSDSLMLELGEESSMQSAPSGPSGEDRLECGDLTILTRSRRVIRGSTEVSLTQKEFDILYFLARNPGEVFTKEQIYQAVWDEKYVMDDSNIMAFIRKLRKKIEPNPDSPKYIQTVWGIGYMFNDRL